MVIPIRIAELRVRLPRHHIDMLEYRAGQQETTVSGVLERELDGIASALLDELSVAPETRRRSSRRIDLYLCSSRSLLRVSASPRLRVKRRSNRN